MKVLVLNSGSSSLKYQLIDMDSKTVIAKGNYERLGEQDAFLTHKIGENKQVFNHPALNHEEAIAFVIEQLTHSEYGVIKALSEIDAVGHRVLHGGEKLSGSVIINEQVIDIIKECIPLGPLHNPPALLGIQACQKLIPGIKMVAVFDTAFHQTIPEANYLYPIPYEYYTKHKIRKYGFHGTSHRFVSKRLAQIAGKQYSKVVTCHLGQGASLCAIKDGKSIDTSMGLTPVAGIMMCARSGDLDPSVVTYMMDKENLTTTQVMNILNKESGVFGLSGLSKDFRDIEEEYQKGNPKAILAATHYDSTVAQYIARYAVELGGLDAIVFTGGVGENQYNTRKRICNNLKFMGVEIDEKANEIRGEEVEVSAPNSKVKIYIIPTDEEMMIAQDTVDLVQ